MFTENSILLQSAREQEVTEDLIQLGIARTTGPGDWYPSAYHVTSYLLAFEYIPALFGVSAYEPVKCYIEARYGKKEVKRNDIAYQQTRARINPHKIRRRRKVVRG